MSVQTSSARWTTPFVCFESLLERNVKRKKNYAHLQADPQLSFGHQENGLDVFGDSVPRREHGQRVQHVNYIEELRVANDGHWPTTRRDPAEEEASHFLAFVGRTRSESIHQLLLTSNVHRCFTKFRVLVEVAGGAGPGVTRYGLGTPGKRRDQLQILRERNAAGEKTI